MKKHSIKMSFMDNKAATVSILEAINKTHWFVAYRSKTKFIFFTEKNHDIGETITVTITDKNVLIESQSNTFRLFQSPKNKYNCKLLEKNLASLSFSSTEIREKFTEFTFDLRENPNKEIDLTTKTQFNPLLPKTRYVVTPLIFYINLLSLIFVALSGASFFLPSPEIMSDWGANTKYLTLQNQYWRLISGAFLHYGFFHFAFNMYALFFIGKELERIVGSFNFLLLYLSFAILSGLTSIWDSTFAVSAGASGAIFGLFGLYIALLTTKHINKEHDKVTTKNVIFYVISAMSMTSIEAIDHYAHFGGLASGIILGFIFMPSVNKPKKFFRKLATYIICIVLNGYAIHIIHTTTENPYPIVEKLHARYLANQKLSESIYETRDTKTWIEELEKNGLERWKENILIVSQLDSIKNKNSLPSQIFLNNQNLKKYSEFRIKLISTMIKGIRENTDKYDQEIKSYSDSISIIVSTLNNDNH